MKDKIREREREGEREREREREIERGGERRGERGEWFINEPRKTLFAETLFLFRSTVTLVGAFSGAIVGFIVLFLVISLVSFICCKKKPSPGTITHPTGLSTVTSSSGSLFKPHFVPKS